MLSKLEEDAEVAYLEYDKAVKAEDRAQSYVNKVKLSKSFTVLFTLRFVETRTASWKGS